MQELILKKCNEIVKGANFTKLFKAKTNEPLFLILSNSDFNLYGSYNSNDYFINYNNIWAKLA